MDEVKAYYAKALAKYQSTSQPTTAAPASQPQIVDKADTKPVEISQRGTEIIIELGYQIDQLVAYHFIHTATEAKGRKLDTTSFEGQCIRWLMTRRTKNTTYSNITLRELAGKIAKSHGLKLEMEGDGPTYQFLDQTGITDMELLLRECRAIGYTIQDDKNKLILKPIRPNFTGFVITQDILIDIQFKDKAEADRQGIGGQNATTPVTQSTPDNPAAEAKAKIDRLTGSVVQQKPEDSTAMGKAGSAQQSSNDVLQQAKAALTGVFGNTLNLDTAKLAASGAGSTTANSGTVAVSGSPSKAVTGTPAPESSTEPVKAGVGQIDPATNLPVQQIGSIELATGQAQAQLLVDINRRVRGYESTATVITTPEVLELAPGSIIGISSNIVPSAFAKEWRVSSVTHSLRPGQFRTTIEFYTPLAYGGRDLSLVNDNSPSSTPSNVPTGKLLNPLPGAQRGTPFDPHGKIRGRAHTGIDLSDGQYSPVQAAESGTVVYVGNQDAGGYGNEVVIAHDGDWKGFTTVYAHLSAFNVSQGQRVTRGQVIGREGATGDSSGPHLHFELHEGTDQSKTNLKDPELYICPPPTGIYDEGAGTPLKCNCPGH
jgi:phage protein D